MVVGFAFNSVGYNVHENKTGHTALSYHPLVARNNSECPFLLYLIMWVILFYSASCNIFTSSPKKSSIPFFLSQTTFQSSTIVLD